MAGDDHIHAGGVLNDVEHLVFGVHAKAQAVALGPQGSVVAHHDQVRVDARLGPLLLDLFHLIGQVHLLVFRRGEDHAGVVVLHIPAGAVGVLQADDADGDLLVAHLDGLEQVGVEHPLAGVLIVEVGADHGHVVVLQIVIDVAHRVPGVVELMVAQDGGVVADVGQGHRHGVHLIRQALGVLADLIGGDGCALIQISVVQKDHVLRPVGVPVLIDRCGHIEQTVVHAGVVEQIGVPHLAVYVGGGHDHNLFRHRVALLSAGGDGHGQICADLGDAPDVGHAGLVLALAVVKPVCGADGDGVGIALVHIHLEVDLPLAGVVDVRAALGPDEGAGDIGLVGGFIVVLAVIQIHRGVPVCHEAHGQILPLCALG